MNVSSFVDNAIVPLYERVMLSKKIYDIFSSDISIKAPHELEQHSIVGEIECLSHPICSAYMTDCTSVNFS